MLSDREVKALFGSALVSGFAIWVLGYYKLIFAIFTHGRPPFDILFMVIPILLITVGVGVMFGAVTLLFLKRFNLFYPKWVLVASVVIPFFLSLVLFGVEYTITQPETAVLCSAGLMGGLFFLVVLRRS